MLGKNCFHYAFVRFQFIIFFQNDFAPKILRITMVFLSFSDSKNCFIFGLWSMFHLYAMLIQYSTTDLCMFVLFEFVLHNNKTKSQWIGMRENGRCGVSVLCSAFEKKIRDKIEFASFCLTKKKTTCAQKTIENRMEQNRTEKLITMDA